MALTRCFWVPGDNPVYAAYHDHEWGFPVDDDFRLFEKICLEGFQAGLSWWTILRKRERFRKVFKGFDFRQVAEFDNSDVARLLSDDGIVRHRGKIEATILNARRACELVKEEGSLAAYLWRFEPDASARPKKLTEEVLRSMSISEESRALSEDLKKRGWKFFGPTTAYAFMQAMGMVNDHTHDCSTRKRVEAVRADFVVPT
ncbi:MAG: DNA-3-methyladenine glycosylase I [Longimicrobiales bacterium]